MSEEGRGQQRCGRRRGVTGSTHEMYLSWTPQNKGDMGSAGACPSSADSYASFSELGVVGVEGAMVVGERGGDRVKEMVTRSGGGHKVLGEKTVYVVYMNR
jgi:hypothetical protein